MKANQDWALMLYNLANIKPSDIYSLTEDTDRALCQNHAETDWSVLLVALHCTACGTFACWMNLFKNELRPFMSVCVCWGGGGVGMGIRWWTFLSSFLYLAEFLKTLLSNGPFAFNSFFFSAEISKVAIIKTKSATIAFFSSPPFLLLPLSFSPFLFLCYVILEILGVKKPAIWSRFTQMTANFVRLVFKKSARPIYIEMKRNYQNIFGLYKTLTNLSR